MQTSMDMTDQLSRYLDLTAAQMKVTAANIANVDTPGYKTQGFSFEQEFASAMNKAGVEATAKPRISEVDGLVARPDGNTVSLDRESMQLAKSQLQFRMGVELLKHEFSGMKSVINAEMR